VSNRNGETEGSQAPLKIDKCSEQIADWVPEKRPCYWLGTHLEMAKTALSRPAC